jgi:putative oxidoreductase
LRVSAQRHFAEAVLAAEPLCPPGLMAWNGSDPARRFAVYRNNVMVSLIDALADSYPVTQDLVGEEFFRAMARLFVRTHPPRSPVLALYGAGLAEFIESFAPAAVLPYLADVARLEMLRVQAWHAADAAPLGLADFAALLENAPALAATGFDLHPSLAVLRSAPRRGFAVGGAPGARRYARPDGGRSRAARIGPRPAHRARRRNSADSVRHGTIHPAPTAGPGLRRRSPVCPGRRARLRSARRARHADLRRSHHQPVSTKKRTCMMNSIATVNAASQAGNSGPIGLVFKLIAVFGRIPDSLIALLGRFSIAAIFWKSGQTKVQGLVIDIVSGEFHFGAPQLSDSALSLFREEYRLPLVAPELAAPLAAFAEHMFPLLILLGLATRFSAIGLLVMTLTIQFLVYPDAYPTHGVWASVLVFLIARGPGAVSVDHLIAARFKPIA